MATGGIGGLAFVSFSSFFYFRIASASAWHLVLVIFFWVLWPFPLGRALMATGGMGGLPFVCFYSFFSENCKREHCPKENTIYKPL